MKKSVFVFKTCDIILYKLQLLLKISIIKYVKKNIDEVLGDGVKAKTMCFISSKCMLYATADECQKTQKIAFL